MKEQIAVINSGVDIVVGTPGRLEDLIKTGYLSLTHCRYFGFLTMYCTRYFEFFFSFFVLLLLNICNNCLLFQILCTGRG